MTFEEIVDQAIEMVRRRGQVFFRIIKRQFDLDDETQLLPLKVGVCLGTARSG